MKWLTAPRQEGCFSLNLSRAQIHYSDEIFYFAVTTTTGESCGGFPGWIGDGACDDENNNEACSWDGGDCCGENVMAQYCLFCGCLNPGAGDSGRPTTTTTTMTPPNHGFGFPGNTGF